MKRFHRGVRKCFGVSPKVFYLWPVGAIILGWILGGTK